MARVELVGNLAQLTGGVAEFNLPATFAKSAMDIGVNFSAAAPSAFTCPPENST